MGHLYEDANKHIWRLIRMSLIMAIYLLIMPFWYATTFAYWQRKFPLIAEEQYTQDIFLALVASFMWPGDIFWWVYNRGKYGMKWR